MSLARIYLALLVLSVGNAASAIETYIVAGQSNGWRLSQLSQRAGSTIESSGRNVYYFGMNCVEEPESATLVKLTSLDERAMGFGLASALSNRSGRDICIIQYCRCGSPVLGPAVNSWWPGDDPSAGKTFDQGLFGKFRSYIQSARLQVKKELNDELEVKGLFWHQGESDAGHDKIQFERALINLFGRFRSEFGSGLPIIAGHIRDLDKGSHGINLVLDKVAAKESKIFAVPLTGLEFAPDRAGKLDVHIALSGCHELGRRMARALTAVRVREAVKAAGGTVEFLNDDVTRVVAVNLYNGNNPLKGNGGRNEMVTDAWLENLAGCDSLRKLDLSNCSITNDGLSRVGQITSLEELNLTLTSISDEGLQYLRDLTRLRVLGLASSQCTGSGFTHLGKLKQLENVNFHFTPLNDEGLRAISDVGISGRLWFAHVKFTDEGARNLVRLKNLKSCGIGSSHPASSGKAVASLVDLPLENLSLLDNQATPEGIAHASRIQSLRRLEIAYAPTATDESLALVAKLPKIEEFRIGAATSVTDAGVAFFTETKSLKKLVLEQVKNITDSGIMSLKKARPDLVIEVR